MSAPAPYEEAEAIFFVALEKTTSQERAAHVDGACAGRAELHQLVRKLLAAHDASHGPLDAPPPYEGATIDQTPLTEGPGMWIGPYKLLQQLGEGGMGVVYLAEQQEPVRRKVALKVIKPGMDSKQVIVRFEAERQALALMNHDNIAHVLDAGTTDAGRPYFVMELVHGLTITKYCDDNHLTPRSPLELFVPVCQAVQHAHQKGVIHRDLKPSNILVTLSDGKPVPKVIDFGVAKATEHRLTDRTMCTQYGAVVGTWEYMAPEQAEMSALGIDTRSDIYSLGVLLYELLTGTTPLDLAAMTPLERAKFLPADIIRMIKEQEPSRPSTKLLNSGTLAAIAAARKTEPGKLTKLLKAELDWVVMKCLEKDRARRYETAAALARDLQRYLADEPVGICRPSATYRLRRFARKNKGTLAVCGAFVLLLLAGIVVSTWQAVRAQAASEQAQKALIREQKERERAEMALTRQVAERLDGEVQQLAMVGNLIAVFLAHCPDWKEEKLVSLLTDLLEKDERIHGLTLAYQPHEGPNKKQKDYCLYRYRSSKNPNIPLTAHLLPVPGGYNPVYRDWDWYEIPFRKQRGQWTGPGFDGDAKTKQVWMVAYSVPMWREGKKEKEPVGVLSVDLELNYFSRLWGWMKELNLGKKSYGFVVNGENFTAAKGKDTTGVFVSHPYFGAGDDANKPPKKITDLGKDDPAFTKLTKRILSGETGRGTAIDPATEKRSTFLFTPVSSTGWLFVVVIED